MTRCAVCNHKERADYDKALILKRTTAADVARAVGCNRSAVTRHLQNHVMPEIAASYLAEAEPELKHVDVLAEMTELYRRMKEHLNKAEGTDDWQAIRAFHAEARKDLELLAKLLGELQQEGAVNVLIAPEWLSIRAAIIQAIDPYPEAREAVLRALSEPN